jgi:peptidase E
MGAKEIYLMSGGRRPSDILQMAEDHRTVFAACGKPNPKAAYIGTANSDNLVFFQAMKIPMLKAGAKSVTMAPLARKNADADAAKRILSGADVIFLSGGEVEDGMVWLEKSGMIGFLTDLYHGGTLFLGVSAGAIMLGQHWVHWDVEGDDSTSRLFSCLNFVPFVFDAHGEKEGWTELKCALRLLGPGAKGHGLSAGGFYSAGENGSFTVFREEPALFCNEGGNINLYQKTSKADM